jgi:hypothetical protein
VPEKWIAVLGGQSTSPAKQEASRSNGKTGGRPRNKGKKFTRCPKRKNQYPRDAHWWDESASPIICRRCKVKKQDARL